MFASIYGVVPDIVYEDLRSFYLSDARSRAIDALLEKFGISGDRIKSQLIECYREHQPSITPYPDVPPALTGLFRTYRVGLISDGWLNTQRNKFNALDIERYFTAILFSDEFGRDHWKPAPLPYLTTCERLGVAPEEAVYIGDNPAKDFLGARRVGMRSIRVRRPDGLHYLAEAPTPEHAPDRECRYLTNIVEIIESLSNE